MTKVFIIKPISAGFFGNIQDSALVSELARCNIESSPDLPQLEHVKMSYFAGAVGLQPMWSDFALANVACSTILLHSTTGLLLPLIGSAGRVVPTNRWKGQDLDLFMLTKVLDAVVWDKLTRYGENSIFIKRYVFKPEVIENHPIFRIKGLPGRIFVTDQFIDFVEANHLIGLTKQLVWSSDREPFDIPQEELVFMDPMKDGKSLVTHAREAMQAILDRRPK